MPDEPAPALGPHESDEPVSIGVSLHAALTRRTVAGLERARKQGGIGGRPRVVTDRDKVATLRAAGKSLGEIAAELNLAKTTVARIAREAAA